VNFSAILNLIRKPTKNTSAAEYRAALEAVDMEGAEKAVDDLEAQRQGLLLQGNDAAVEDIEARIRTGNREIEKRHAAKGELARLLAEAEARELAAMIEQRAAAARTAQAEGLRLFVEIDAAAVNLCGMIDKLDAIRAEIRESNFSVVEHKRPDLKTAAPDFALAQHLGLSTPEALANPHAWSLPGYRSRALDGSLIGPSKHRLARARELLADRNKAA
jgi:hypothetical protein